MQVYQISPEADRYRDLYETARNMAGVEYIGSVSQTQLAQDLPQMAALAYPSNFAETSCIAVTEAMAAGAAVYTTRLGALPETTGMHATMIDWQPDKTALAGAFADMVTRSLQEARKIRKMPWRSSHNAAHTSRQTICGRPERRNGNVGWPLSSAKANPGRSWPRRATSCAGGNAYLRGMICAGPRICRGRIP